MASLVTPIEEWAAAYRRLGRKAAHGSAHHPTDPDPAWIASGLRDVAEIVELADPAVYRTVLDYGCGPGRLSRPLACTYSSTWAYDPALPDLDVDTLFVRRPDAPVAVSLIVAVNVLAHVPPPDLPATLAEIRDRTAVGGRLVATVLYAAQPLSYEPGASSIPGGVHWWTHDGFLEAAGPGWAPVIVPAEGNGWTEWHHPLTVLDRVD